MKGLNKVMGIGNLGKDPEIKYMPDGKALCTFPIACTDTWKDKQTGEMKERTEWMNIEVWGNQAEACNDYLSKGRPCYVEGSLRTDKWQDKEGIDRWTTKVRANTVIFLGDKQGGGAKSGNNEPPKPKQDEFEDDIPF